MELGHVIKIMLERVKGSECVYVCAGASYKWASSITSALHIISHLIFPATL